MSPSCPYQYETLGKGDSIRLLQLKPATSSDMIIQCELIDVDLSTASEYEALSYVWGNDDMPNFLHLPSGHLQVTENLASALRGLRYGGKSRLL